MARCYLNNAASSFPKAPGVSEAVREALETPPFSPERSTEKHPDSLTECRTLFARLLQVETPGQVVLTKNATEAINLAVWGIAQGKPLRVVLSRGEHNSLIRPLLHRIELWGGEVCWIELTPEGDPDLNSFEKICRVAPPDLLAMTHGSNVTGRLFDIGAFFEKAKALGAITLLDASQTCGHVLLSPEKLKADLVAITGHKALHGPAGTGALYVSPPIQLSPLFTGGTGIRSDLLTQPPEMPIRLEAGTPNMPAFAGLARAIDWHLKNATANEKQVRALTANLFEGMRTIPGLTVLDPGEAGLSLGIVSCRCAGWSVEELGFILEESFGIVCRTGLHCAPLVHAAIGTAPEGTVRLSLSAFTRQEEIEMTLQALQKLVCRK